MRDKLGRTIDYMRISITDRCNLRCTYCMPRDLPVTDMAEILTFEEIVRVVEAAVELGIVNFRVTGGEPLARRGAVELVRMIKAVPGVRAVKMTTNGVQLSESAAALKAAGLDGLNISLDVLDAESFRALTGRDAFDRALAGIDAALAAGIPVKLNAVCLPDTDPVAMVRFAEEKGLQQRFIEMMPIGHGREHMGRANRELIAELEKAFGPATFVPKGPADPGSAAADAGSGPAAYYRFPQLARPVGFISALSKKFCGSCNRVRLTAEGYLKLCLCYGDGLDLRALLRADAGRRELAEAIEAAVREKPAEHCFEHTRQISEKKDMSQIGG